MIYCIYHSRDLDGYCSGAIVKKKFPDAVLIGFDYGEPLQKLLDAIPQGSEVVMVDVSLPMPEMKLLSEHADGFTWIDHHQSAIVDYAEFTEAADEDFLVHHLYVGLAACELTWEYYFPNETMPTAVKLLGQYDTWRNSDAEHWDFVVMPFQFGMRLNVSSAERFPQELLAFTQHVNDILVLSVLTIGESILKYQRQQNEIAMRAAFEIEWNGYRVLACNGAGFNSDVFASKWDESRHDLMMPFRFNGKLWVFSLYTTKDIDCSQLAKGMGGGGHKKAAGFQLPELPDFISQEVTE